VKVWLDVFLPASVHRHEVHKHVAREPGLEVFETLELAGARGTPGRAEAEHCDFPSELLRVESLAREIRERKCRRGRLFAVDEDVGVLRDGGSSKRCSKEEDGSHPSHGRDRIASATCGVNA